MEKKEKECSWRNLEQKHFEEATVRDAMAALMLAAIMKKESEED